MAAINDRSTAQAELGDGDGVDGSRLAQYLQHIRALNSQFASWVQQQIKEHPDVFWKEGLQDYLRHASTISENFKDVARSCKVPPTTSLQSARSQCVNLFDRSSSAGLGLPSKPFTETQPNLVFGQPVLPALAVPSSSPTTSGFSLLNIPTQRLAGQAPTNSGDDTHDDDAEQNEPSSPSLKRTDEPGIKLVHETKCKLYVKGDHSDKPWNEMGAANLMLKCKEGMGRGTKEAKATIVVRNEVGRILLNALLYPGIKMSVQKNTVTGIFLSAETGSGAQVNSAPQGKPYLFKLKTERDAEKLVEAITLNAPAGD